MELLGGGERDSGQDFAVEVGQRPLGAGGGIDRHQLFRLVERLAQGDQGAAIGTDLSRPE